MLDDLDTVQRVEVHQTEEQHQEEGVGEGGGGHHPEDNVFSEEANGLSLVDKKPGIITHNVPQYMTFTFSY